MKVEVVILHIEVGWTYRRIMEHLVIPDRNRLKVWMKKYKKSGESGLMNKRGRREEYSDQDRYVHKLKQEIQMLKKCLKSVCRRFEEKI
ncbi:helix-turn-helix domain-containing protein [Paenibacillus taichungensis]|uniref:helix-turn-helix domain-containing protein n=1 Tax=Paenibacillus taichungensis TaxID=484184 RepID=UPI003815EE70